MDLDHKTLDTRIRIAVPENAPAIASVLFDSFIEYKSRYTPEGFAATTPSSDQIQDRLTEGPTWVVTCSDRIVGTVSVVPRDGSLYIRGHGHRARCQGKGSREIALEAN